LDLVEALAREGRSGPEIRALLFERGYKKARVSQLLQQTAGAGSAPARPPVKKRPASVATAQAASFANQRPRLDAAIEETVAEDVRAAALAGGAGGFDAAVSAGEAVDALRAADAAEREAVVVEEDRNGALWSAWRNSSSDPESAPQLTDEGAYRLEDAAEAAAAAAPAERDASDDDVAAIFAATVEEFEAAVPSVRPPEKKRPASCANDMCPAGVSGDAIAAEKKPREPVRNDAGEGSADDALRPKVGEPIIVLVKTPLDQILALEKTLEIRGVRWAKGRVYLGMGGKIYGVCDMARGEEIPSVAKWNKLRPLHLVAKKTLPYPKTYGHALSNVHRFQEPIPYQQRQGQVNRALYRPVVVASSTQKDVKNDGAVTMRKRPASSGVRKRPASMAPLRPAARHDVQPFFETEAVGSGEEASSGESDSPGSLRDFITDSSESSSASQEEAASSVGNRSAPGAVRKKPAVANVAEGGAVQKKPAGHRAEEAASSAANSSAPGAVRKKPAVANVLEGGAVQKKPAGWRARSDFACQGRDGAPCVFSLSAAMCPALVTPSRDQTRCLFCEPGALQAAHAKKNGKAIVEALRKMQQHNADCVEQAVQELLDALGEAAATDLRNRAAVKRPVTELCLGRANGTACAFSLAAAGCRARVQPARDHSRCMFCDAACLRQRAATSNGLHLVAALNKLHGYGGAPWESAKQFCEEVLGNEPAQEFIARAERLPCCEKWEELLSQRKSVAPKATRDARDAYPDWVRDDTALRNKKFSLAFDPDIEPESWMTPLAQHFHQWARWNSWVMCAQCQRLQKRPFQAIDAANPSRRKQTVTKCTHCASGAGYGATKIDDIPEVLRDLSEEALEALRPIEIDVGVYERGDWGYRVHTDMTSFHWRPTRVEDQIAGLSRKHRRKAKAAWKYLQEQSGQTRFRSLDEAQRYFQEHPDETAYGAFIELHNRFLAHHGVGATWRQTRLPARWIETVGLETCLWPHLYPRIGMCETYVRSQDVRRRQRDVVARRKRFEARLAADDSESGSGRDDEGDCSDGSSERSSDGEEENGRGRNSLKASFLAKVMSPVIGYQNDFRLAQFVYDLWLWSNIGGKKHASNVNLRVAMGGMTFSPEYWKTRHLALTDLARQIGYPSLFITIAPFEWSAPYHEWVEDEMRRTLRSKLHLPGAETFHLAHILTQAVIALISGANQQSTTRASRRWSHHVLASKNGEQKTIVNYFGRLEFQDGKRKRGFANQRHAYHKGPGSGRPHVHFLVWLTNEDCIDLPGVISAKLPNAETEPVMREVVLSSQQSYTGSGWAERDEASVWDEAAKVLRLEHGAEEKQRGIRAFMRDVIGALRC